MHTHQVILLNALEYPLSTTNSSHHNSYDVEVNTGSDVSILQYATKEPTSFSAKETTRSGYILF
jgi:hypothetical protein